MQILLTELGNQQSRYWGNKLSRVDPRFLTYAPDLTLTTQSERADCFPNDLLRLAMPLLEKFISENPLLICLSFPHETDPAVIIGSRDRNSGYHQPLESALAILAGNGIVSEVKYVPSVYRY